MEKVAEFYKVSFEQFEKDYKKIFPNNTKTRSEIEDMYNSIKLPARGTSGSAGYDFFLPFDITLKSGEEITIPTGIRFKSREDYALFVFSRSGLGTRNRLQLNTAVSIIDSDYFYSDNEGHMMYRVIHDSRCADDVLTLESGKGFIQGVFIPYGITESDNVQTKRNGGFGSTTQN